MTLRTSAWTDGGAIPVAHSQAGPEISPPLAWSGAPADTVRYVLLVHDVDVANGAGEDMLHRMCGTFPRPLRDSRRACRKGTSGRMARAR